MEKGIRVVISIGIVFLVLSFTAVAQAAFPEKPITVLVWTSAGGPTDLYGRVVAKLAEKYLKQPLVVQNKPGGDGAVAMAYVLSQPADGYLVLINTLTMCYLFAEGKAPFGPKDFSQVIRQAAEPFATVVRSESRFKSIEDLVAYGRANPGKISIGGPQFGGSLHISAERMARAYNIRIKWIPYASSNDAFMSMLGGHIDSAQITPGIAQSHLEAGKVRILVHQGEQPLSYAPDVPTLKKKGLNIVGYNWRGAMVKKGTPKPVIMTLHDAFNKVTADKEWKDYFSKNGLVDSYLEPSEFDKNVAMETTTVQELLKDLKAKEEKK